MRLAPGSVTCAEMSVITGPAWAGAAQPAARQVPRTATRPAAAFLTVPQALTAKEAKALREAPTTPETRPARAALAAGRIGADFGVRADVGVPGMMTDLTCLGSSNALTPRDGSTVWGLRPRRQAVP